MYINLSMIRWVYIYYFLVLDSCEAVMKKKDESCWEKNYGIKWKERTSWIIQWKKILIVVSSRMNRNSNHYIAQNLSAWQLYKCTLLYQDWLLDLSMEDHRLRYSRNLPGKSKYSRLVNFILNSIVSLCNLYMTRMFALYIKTYRIVSFVPQQQADMLTSMYLEKGISC